MPWPPALGLILAACLYVLGIRRVVERGVRWDPRRTMAYAGGLVAIALATSAPLASHDDDIRVHMLQHLLLGMLGPLLLALSAPGTLLLRALPPERRAPLVRVLHARAARTILHPCTTVVLAVGSLYVLYFTPVYAATLRSEPLHELVHLHMLVAGCALTWSLVGLDPVPHRPALRLRSAALIAAIAAHAVLGRLLYAHAVTLATTGSSADRWRQGAQVLFYGGDLVDLGLLSAFFGQWYAREGRRAAPRRRTAEGTAAP
jgi:putative membrane protein